MYSSNPTYFPSAPVILFSGAKVLQQRLEHWILRGRTVLSGWLFMHMLENTCEKTKRNTWYCIYIADVFSTPYVNTKMPYRSNIK